MSDLGDQYRELRAAQQLRRAARLPKRTAEILALREQGFKVEQLTEHQFRINDRLDLYPIHNRWHDIKTRQRGSYGQAGWFVRRFFKVAKQEGNSL